MRSFECHESHNRRSLQLIGPRHNRSLRNRTVRNKRALYFRCSESMSAYINNIIDPTHNPEIPVLVAARAIARKIDTFNLRPVLLLVTFVVAPDGPQHRRPRSLDHEIPAF